MVDPQLVEQIPRLALVVDKLGDAHFAIAARTGDGVKPKRAFQKDGPWNVRRGCVEFAVPKALPMLDGDGPDKSRFGYRSHKFGCRLGACSSWRMCRPAFGQRADWVW